MEYFIIKGSNCFSIIKSFLVSFTGTGKQQLLCDHKPHSTCCTGERERGGGSESEGERKRVREIERECEREGEEERRRVMKKE